MVGTGGELGVTGGSLYFDAFLASCPGPLYINGVVATDLGFDEATLTFEAASEMNAGTVWSMGPGAATFVNGRPLGPPFSGIYGE